ncbi:MAG: gliding motility-associated C-terminal domain-containing protein [Crocinitomicaceae bacterium]
MKFKKTSANRNSIKLSFFRNTVTSSKGNKMMSFAVVAVLTLVNLISGSLWAQTSTTYNYTGAVQTYTVPPCVTSITVTAAGAKGGGPAGGNGAVITGTVAVTPGQVLQLYVGGMGAQPGAGWNGGGVGWSGAPTSQPASGGGGGASDVRIAPYALTNRVVVAGGGGGISTGSSSNIVGGGAGGCAAGVIGFGSVFTSVGGGGGTQTAGGVGGPFWPGGSTATQTMGSPGALGVGGAGAHDLNFGASGGGGGGGYYGGGGGGADNCCTGGNGGGAGGGGSSYCANLVSCTNGTNATNGYITIVTNAITITNSAATTTYCAGSNIQLNSSGGASNYSWVGPSGFTSSVQNPLITNATVANSGLYILTATIGACVNIDSLTVTVLPTPVVSAGPDDTTCFGSPILLNATLANIADGRFWTNLTTGITPVPTVTFSPALNSITPTVTVNQPGLYTFMITESTGLCGLVTDTVKIFVKQMTASAVGLDPTCGGYSDGEIQVTGWDATEYSFDNGATWVNTPNINTFPAGSYTVCARDINMCTACVPVTIVDPIPIVISLSNDTLICQNGTATLTASATGGTGVYYFDWQQFPTGTPSYFATSTEYGSPLVDTYYLVDAYSTDGCHSGFDSIYVTVREPISGTISPNVLICPGYPTTLTATAADGIGVPYTFTWSDGSVGTGASNSISANPPVTQPYSVTITDGCESTPLILYDTVTVSPLPIPSFVSLIPELCEPANFKLNITTDPTTYVASFWQISDGEQYLNVDTVNTAGIMAGAYDVQLVLYNMNGCIDSVTYPGYLISHALPKAAYKFSPSQPTMFSTTVAFDNFSTGAVSAQWTFQSGNPPVSSSYDASTKFPDGYTGLYDVTMIVTSDFGCKDTLENQVEVIPEVILYAPNTFTPDGDEFNPTWKIYIEGIDVADFNLEVRDRWGHLVWQSFDVNGEWDGTFDNQVVQSGVYNWSIRAKDLISDKPYIFKGSVSILR